MRGGPLVARGLSFGRVGVGRDQVPNLAPTNVAYSVL